MRLELDLVASDATPIDSGADVRIFRWGESMALSLARLPLPAYCEPSEWLTPSERPYAYAYNPVRLEEFAAGRVCARAALRALGVECDGIGRREDGGPIQPGEACISISHSRHWVCAIAAKRPVEGIGVDVHDAEDPISDESWERIAHAQEEWVDKGTDPDKNSHPREWKTRVFSAKEAAWKCLHSRHVKSLETKVGLENVAILSMSKNNHYDVYFDTTTLANPQMPRKGRGRFWMLPNAWIHSVWVME
jgi:4'-phosphopantetheinyl transferase EntD